MLDRNGVRACGIVILFLAACGAGVWSKARDRKNPPASSSAYAYRDGRCLHGDKPGLNPGLGECGDFSAKALGGEPVRGRNLAGASFRIGRLSGADFSLADLRGADLRGATAIHTKWEGARLDGGDLRGLKAPRSSFDHASLRGARMAMADLAESSLRYADLRGADLSQAVLLGADLTGAITDENTRLRGKSGTEGR